MLKMLLPLMTVLLLWQRVASIDELCRECICANSGGRAGYASNCVMRDPYDCLEGKYCGPYGMTEEYWSDAGAQGDSFHSCMGDWACANNTLDAYLDRYCLSTFVGHSPPCSCEENARLHHCGPYSLDQAFCNSYYDGVFTTCMENS